LLRFPTERLCWFPRSTPPLPEPDGAAAPASPLLILRIGGLPTSSLDALASELCSWLQKLPDTADDLWPRFEDAYTQERRRQRERLLAAAENPELRGGLALGR